MKWTHVKPSLFSVPAGAATAVMAVTLTLTSFGVLAQQPAAPTPASPTSPTPPLAPVVIPTPVPTSFDRLTFSGNGSSLTGTNGGAGASLGWLHNFDSDTLIGAAAEHQVLSVSHWTFGSLNASMTRGSGDQRYTVYGEAHEGAGDDAGKAFKYRVEGLGLTGTYFHRLSATVEDKQFNVESTHGNLPKVGLSYLWNQHVQTGLAYQYSFGGNLGTRLTSGRLDLYGPVVNFLGGFAVGQASPSVLGLALTLSPHDLTEGYVGLAKSLPQWRSDLTLILDYQRLSGGSGFSLSAVGGPTTFIPTGSSTRVTGTLTYIYHLNGM
jgi:hypothetical protein